MIKFKTVVLCLKLLMVLQLSERTIYSGKFCFTGYKPIIIQLNYKIFLSSISLGGINQYLKFFALR